MKITIAQLNYQIGHFERNAQKMLEAVEQAKTEGAELIVFSELAVCGYPPRDFLEFDDFIEQSLGVVDRLREAAKGIAILVGAPERNPLAEGKDLYNAAYFLVEGRIEKVVRKTLLPTYDIFDEYRYFEPNSRFECVEFKGMKLAVTICEDIWNIGNENPLYKVCPMDILIGQKPDLMINLSASPFDHKHRADRHEILKANADRYGLPIIYANGVGAQTEVIFDGGSMLCNAQGKIVYEMDYFKECVKTFELEADLNTYSGSPELKDSDRISRIHDALVLGIKDYFSKLGFEKAILGLSGGIDSAVTLALAVEALGEENVLSVLLPSEFSSDHSVSDSLEMIETLGSPHELIPIKDQYESFLSGLSTQFKDLPFGLAEENLQARSAPYRQLCAT